MRPMSRHERREREAGRWPAQAERPATTAAAAPVQLPLRGSPDDSLLLDPAAARAHYGPTPALDSWAAFLGGFFPTGATFLTLSYSDEGAERHKAYRPAACFGDAQRFFTRQQLDGPAFLVCERHRDRGSILHMHGLIHPLEKADRLRLMKLWEPKRGWARALPATAGAFPYVCKYALKDSDRLADFIDLRHLPRFTPWTRS